MAILNKSLNELAYDFIELYRANHKDTDSLDVRQVKNWIDNTRATLIKQRLDRNPFAVDGSWTQTITVAGASVTYFESTEQLPIPINRRGGEGCITLIDDGTLFADKIEFTTYAEAKSYNNGKFNATTKYAFLKEAKLFIKNETTATSLPVTGVWQSPRIAAAFNSVANFDSSMTYPVDQSILDNMKNMILKTNFNFVVQQIEDRIADGVDSTTKEG